MGLQRAGETRLRAEKFAKVVPRGCEGTLIAAFIYRAEGIAARVRIFLAISDANASITLNGTTLFLADYHYGPGFPGFGLPNPWVDGGYLGYAWHLSHPAFVKGKLAFSKTHTGAAATDDTF